MSIHSKGQRGPEVFSGPSGRGLLPVSSDQVRFAVTRLRQTVKLSELFGFWVAVRGLCLSTTHFTGPPVPGATACSRLGARWRGRARLLAQRFWTSGLAAVVGFRFGVFLPRPWGKAVSVASTASPSLPGVLKTLNCRNTCYSRRTLSCRVKYSLFSLWGESGISIIPQST